MSLYLFNWKEGIDLQKGILLTGMVGSGKTSLMSLIRNLAPECYWPHMVSVGRLIF